MSSRLFLACAALLASLPLFAQSTPDFSAVERHAQQEIAAGKVPSLAFALAVDGKIVYEAAFGFADQAGQVPATPHTAYALASASKPITATALMLLAEKRKVDLSASVQKYLAPLQFRAGAGRGAAVSLDQLLSHTSGLGTYAQIHYGDAIATAPDLAASFQRYGVLVQKPGAVSVYSNLGYGLVGEVIERRSGESFEAFLAQQLFAPLQMADSFVDAAGARAVAVNYGVDNEVLPPLHNDTPGAGNIHSSAHDLARFGLFHLDPARIAPGLLRPATVARMQRQAQPRAFHHYYGKSYYGLGWYVRPDDNGYRVLWHEGGMPGASSILKLLPDRRIAVAVLANRTDVNALTQAIANELLQLVEPAYRPLPLDPIANYQPYAAQAEFLGRWSGHIVVDGDELPCALEFKADGKVQVSYGKAGAQTQAETGGLVYRDSFIGAVQAKLPVAAQAGAANPLLLLKLIRDGKRINGSLVAYASPQRLEYLLPFYVRLEREK